MNYQNEIGKTISPLDDASSVKILSIPGFAGIKKKDVELIITITGEKKDNRLSIIRDNEVHSTTYKVKKR